MSASHGIQALRALAAAWEAKRLYGRQHDAFRLAVDRCVAALEPATRESGAVTLAICEDGIVWDDQIVIDRAVESSDLIASLAARGLTCLRFAPGAAKADIEWLLEDGRDLKTPRSPSGKLVIGRIDGGATARRPSQPRSSIADRPAAKKPRPSGLVIPGGGLADQAPLKKALASLLTGAQQVPAEVGVLAANITAAVVSGGNGLIPLVNLKDHDEYTYVHAVNVGLLSSALGQAIGLSGERLSQITEAALLHDVGKRMVPIDILNKKCGLSDDERRVVQLHPAQGASLLAGVRGVSDLAVVAAYEHDQRIDGGGYPKAVRGRFPSLPSQLIQIADIFDALRSDRPYRKGLSTPECIDIMLRDSGISFDSQLFEAFRAIVLRRVEDPAESPEGASDLKAQATPRLRLASEAEISPIAVQSAA